MEAGLLLCVKQLIDVKRAIVQVLRGCAVDRLVLLIADTVPCHDVHGAQVGGHESSRHLHIVRIGLQDPCGSFAAVLRKLHILVVVGNGQALVFRSALRNLQHALNGVLRLVKAHGPQTGDNLHTVVGLCHRVRRIHIPHRCADTCEELVRDPVHGIEVADAGPGGNGAFHSRKAQQIVLFDCCQNSEKRLRPAAVRVLADRLAHAFLQPCRHQEFGQKFMELSIIGLHNAPDQRHGDQHSIVVTENRLAGRLDDGIVPLVDSRCHDIVKLNHMQMARIGILPDKISKFRIDIARCAAGLQVLKRRDAIHAQHLVGLHEAEGVQHVRHGIFGAHCGSEQRSGILEIRKLIQHIVVIRAVLLGHQQCDQVPP